MPVHKWSFLQITALLRSLKVLTYIGMLRFSKSSRLVLYKKSSFLDRHELAVQAFAGRLFDAGCFVDEVCAAM